MDRRKLVLAAVIAALVAAFFAFDLGHYLDLDFLRSQRDRLHDLFVARPFFVGAVFFAAYVAVTGLCLPGAAVLTLVAGAIFGLGWGMVIASFAATLGATHAAARAPANGPDRHPGACESPRGERASRG